MEASQLFLSLLPLCVCTDLVMAPAANTTNIGLDTLEEEEEKAKFFAQLEAGALSTIDYSKLNRELDSTTSSISTNLRYAEGRASILRKQSTKEQDNFFVCQ